VLHVQQPPEACASDLGDSSHITCCSSTVHMSVNAVCVSVIQHYWLSNDHSLWTDSGAFIVCCFFGCRLCQQICHRGAEDSARVWKVGMDMC